METTPVVWLVAGGEPGAKRFGQLVQRCRQARKWSVQDLADRVGMSAGSIRAVEQGRRAPSQESGVRLLRALLPEDAVSVPPERRAADVDAGAAAQGGVSFVDPESGGRVVVEFRARKAGDNRRWSSDAPPEPETEPEAMLRELLADPERRQEWVAELREHVLPALGTLATAGELLRERASRPAPDADFGRLVRRLSGLNEFDLERLEGLLDLWDLVADGKADEAEQERHAQVNRLLDSVVKLPDEDASASPQ